MAGSGACEGIQFVRLARLGVLAGTRRCDCGECASVMCAVPVTVETATQGVRCRQRDQAESDAIFP